MLRDAESVLLRAGEEFLEPLLFIQVTLIGGQWVWLNMPAQSAGAG